ncbi:MAG TPA: hypothetical protein VFQ44_15990 [Streptosporangiaceae bacterium]|nr:hypothetical protein [Streptosporangiaceae bacterium]
MADKLSYATWRLTSEDEQLHPPGPEQLWNESYYFDFAASDGSVAGYVRLGLYPTWRRCWYWACAVRPGAATAIVVDNAIPLPCGRSIQTESISASQEISRPLESAYVALDADAVVLKDRAAAYGDLTALPSIRLAFELEWVTFGGVYPYRMIPRYEIPCRVTGTIRIGADRLTVDGWGERDHSWGVRDWWKTSWLWSAGRIGDGTAFHGMQANNAPLISPSFTVTPEGRLRRLTGFSAATDFGPDQFPRRSTMRLSGTCIAAVPLSFAAVGLISPEGQVSHFPRALCRYEVDDGKHGYGWTEWNQPTGWRDHDWSGRPARSRRG